MYGLQSAREKRNSICSQPAIHLHTIPVYSSTKLKIHLRESEGKRKKERKEERKTSEQSVAKSSVSFFSVLTSSQQDIYSARPSSFQLCKLATYSCMPWPKLLTRLYRQVGLAIAVVYVVAGAMLRFLTG